MATDQHRIVLNKTNTVSKFEDNRGKPDIKFVENPSWRKGILKFLWLCFSHQIHIFIISNCLAFLTENLRCTKH